MVSIEVKVYKNEKEIYATRYDGVDAAYLEAPDKAITSWDVMEALQDFLLMVEP